MILLQYSPKYVPMLPTRLRFQFLFSQVWYPLFAFFMLCMFLMPVIALATRENFADVTFPEFVIHYAPLSVMLIGLIWLFQKDGWARPHNSKSLSWEGTLFLFARWPWALAGTIAALRDHLTGSFVDFRVTPKGTGPKSALPLRVIAPYVVLTAVSAVPVLAFDDARSATGFYFFAALNAAIYALLLIVILVRHVMENGIAWKANAFRLAFQAAMACAVLALPAMSFGSRGLEGLHGLEQGAGRLSLTRIKYSVSGAGQGSAGMRRFELAPEWRASGDDKG